MKLIAEYEIEYKGWYWVHKMKLSAREEIEYLPTENGIEYLKWNWVQMMKLSTENEIEYLNWKWVHTMKLSTEETKKKILFEDEIYVA